MVNEHEIIGGVALVKASNTGRVFIVDADDYGKIKDLLWRENDNGYIISQLPGDIHVLLHRLITNAQKGEVVDHINHLKYDNRKDNLRVANQEYNMMNACGRKNNTSGRKGVWQDKRNGRWVAEIKANKKKINLGHYSTFEEAVKAREQGEEKYFGAWSYANSAKVGEGNVTDYISRKKDKYIKLSQALEVLDSCSCWWAHDRMEALPAADVRPVVRAKREDDWETGCSTCSACGEGYLWEDYDGVGEWNFCPNCGADMMPQPPKEE